MESLSPTVIEQPGLFRWIFSQAGSVAEFATDPLLYCENDHGLIWLTDLS